MKKLFFALALFLHFYAFAQLKSPKDFLLNYGKQVSFYNELESYDYSKNGGDLRVVDEAKFNRINLYDFTTMILFQKEEK